MVNEKQDGIQNGKRKVKWINENYKRKERVNEDEN